MGVFLHLAIIFWLPPVEDEDVRLSSPFSHVLMYQFLI